jgi:hypothetical protein
MSAATILDRLQGVKETGLGRWVACCPAHADRSPSLSIRELGDGRLLLHDFGGCATDDVLAAVGLKFAALFPAPLLGAGEHRHVISPLRIPDRDLLEVISEETSVVALLAADMLANKTISEVDWHRLAAAARRIGRARDHLYGA